MSNKVSIGIEAQIDTGAVAEKINQLGAKIAQANKVQYNPVNVKTADDLNKIVKQFEQLRRVQGDLNKRMKSTGQSSAGLLDVDWEKLYPDQHSRTRQMRKAFEYSVGPQFGASTQPAAPGRPQGGGGGGGGIGPRIVQAGLGAAGPAGRVAAGAVGTGMSAGFGAGLMGLMGGMLALGVSKIVGGAMENLGKAQANDMAMDRLKRVLGDVNVSFGALKSVVNASATNLKVTYDEAGKLATQFTKLGNLSGDKMSSLGDELGTGVGMSRAFGLDPSQGVGVMGQMRGIGATSNTQESRRFALLIGETIGKSKAFAKSEEVMEALASYTTSQTRSNMGRANTEGYAGMYSSMVGSGIPGLDPSGAGAMLGRMNAALSSGGAKGEASQFFTAMVGQKMGLSTLQTQVMREGGMFATNDGMFGDGGGDPSKASAYSRYMGKAGPKGSSTFYENTRAELERQYGGDSDDQKLLRAQAFGNHTGLNMTQSMAMLTLKPNQMGGLAKYGDLKGFNAAGIGNLAKVHGTNAERTGVYDSMLRRDDVSPAEKEKLKLDMGKADGDVDKQREILATLVATKDQEQTDGKTLREQKAQVDNIATRIAGELIPAVNAMKAGIIWMAGDKKLTESGIMKEVAGLESAERRNTIKGEFASKYDATNTEGSRLQSRLSGLNIDRLRVEHRGDPQKLAEKMKEREEVLAAIVANDKKRLELGREEADLLEKENTRRKTEIAKIEKAAAAASAVPGAAPITDGGGSGQRNAEDPRRSDRAPGGGSLDTSSIDAQLAEADRKQGFPPGTMKSLMQQETGGKQAYLDDPAKYHYGPDKNGRRTAPHTGKVSTAFGPFGILESTANKPGFGVAPLKDKSVGEQIRFSSEYLGGRVKSAGSLEAGLAGYGEGPAYGRQVMGRIRRGGTPVAGGTNTALPDGYRPGDAAMGGGRITVDDITVRHVGPDGRPVAANETVQTKYTPPSPYGALRTGGATGSF